MMTDEAFFREVRLRGVESVRKLLDRMSEEDEKSRISSAIEEIKDIEKKYDILICAESEGDNAYGKIVIHAGKSEQIWRTEG